MKIYSPLAAALMASGCAGLSAQRADLEAYRDARLPDTPSAWAVVLPEPAETSDWVSQFGSGVLASLITEAMDANPDVASSLATAEAAQANFRSVYGRALPQVTASSQAGYTDAYSAATDDRVGVESYSLGLSASWEVDVWGRVSRAVKAARADVVASEADYDGVRLSIAGSVARGWVSLINTRAQLALSRDELRLRENNLTVTERRLAAGVSTALDVRLARSAVASTRASIAAAERDLSDAARSLEVLLGRYPAAAIDAPEVPPKLGPMQDLSSPTDLLARRPDIAAAEARLGGAGLRAELARQAILPTLSLSASATLSSNDIADLIDVEQLAGNVLASITQPIFRGGSLKADADAALANARRAIAQYSGAVLDAWREVESAREADIHLADQESALEEALVEAEAAEVLAERQYQRGLISIFNLIDAQTRRISAERQLLNVRASRAANRIIYHIALGGGDMPMPAIMPADG